MIMLNPEDKTSLVAVRLSVSADLYRGVNPRDLAGSVEHACVLCLCGGSSFVAIGYLDMSSARDGLKHVHR
jgi:hypothetical protein